MENTLQRELFTATDTRHPTEGPTTTMPRWEGTMSAFTKEFENPEAPWARYRTQWEEGELTNPWGCLELSAGILRALHHASDPKTAFVVNSSTGKDSTVTCQALLEAVRAEIEAGHGWSRQITVAIADTASEFPEMKARMKKEADALNELAETWKIPLKAVIVKPEPKHRLLVELCGNGKPVPAVSNTGKAQGVSAWCMDRVKAGTLNKIAREMTRTHGSYIPILGTRSAESTRRKQTIAKHAGGLPPGLSRVAQGAHWALAATPITFWPNKAVSDFLRAFPSPWRPQGREELRAIYFKGSPLEGEENFTPSECAVSISEEGKISNSCSDLSGTRYGCWHCFLSTNKSLKNTAKRDPKYLWPRKFHAYVHKKGTQAIQRGERLKAMGFTREDSFSKTFTFLERYKILMFLMRAELESGLTLLEPEEENQIGKFWERHGVFCVTPADAREDALAWKKTGRWKAFFEDIEDEAQRLCLALSEGIPFGAIAGIQACQEEEKNQFTLQENNHGKRPAKELEMTHLLAFTGQGFGSPPYPKLLAYVFQENNQEGNKPKAIVTALTDTPCLLGLPTNTGLLNGMSGTLWDCIGVRLPIPWEKKIAGDRNFVYRIHPDQNPKNSCTKSCPPLQIMELAYQNQILAHGCKTDDPYKDHWFDLQMIQGLSPLTREELKAIFDLSYELTATSETLTDHFGDRRRRILREINPWREQILEASPEGKEARRQIRKLVRQNLGLEKIAPVMHHYAKGMKLAAKAIRAGMLNTSLMLKLSYVHHMFAVDPAEGHKSLMELLRHIPLKERPGEGQEIVENQGETT
jgi:3'-phosphoadenosine 5'-phosphosulfate sulfotransferase (PAPS reductase)/FAD synthetase